MEINREKARTDKSIQGLLHYLTPTLCEIEDNMITCEIEGNMVTLIINIAFSCSPFEMMLYTWLLLLDN